MTPPQWREQLNKALDEIVPDDLWRYLEEMGYVQDADIEGAEQGLALLVSEVHRLRTRGPKLVAAHPHEWGTPAGPARVSISVLLAVQAAARPAVIRFRGKYIPSQLLELHEVGTWIEARAAAEGAPAIQVVVPIPDASHEPDGPDQVIVDLAAHRVAGLALGPTSAEAMLEYQVPGEEWHRVLAVARGGALAALQRLGVRLAADYNWTAAQATVFLLTDGVPLISQSRARTPTSWRVNIDDDQRLPSSTLRIELRVDPSFTPSEVAAEYRKVRSTMLGGRYRPISEKHATLARVRAEHPGDSWTQRMVRWNATQRISWRYPDRRQFARDAREAERRLLNPPFRPALPRP